MLFESRLGLAVNVLQTIKKIKIISDMMSGEKMECLIPVKVEKEWKIVKERKRRREGRKKRKKERRKEEEGILKKGRKEG